MNIKLQATRVLCYGDSNTWGRSGASVDRYTVGVRWTSLLQAKLGNDFEVIEEGLRSRTTDIDDDDPQFPGRNGLAYLRPCLESHNPVDVVILWLGTNDFKTKFNREAKDVAEALKTLITEVKNVASSKKNQLPKIILVSPPLIKEEVLKPHSQFAGAGRKSKELAPLIKNLAEETGCEFVNLSSIEPGDFDGVHLEPEAHQSVANELYKIFSYYANNY
ncbi:acylhydrolase [Candidatus Woesebacteria bacterium]|nr:acylhydrolase [Candidatus Woesebacteria bacterium]